MHPPDFFQRKQMVFFHFVLHMFHVDNITSNGFCCLLVLENEREVNFEQKQIAGEYFLTCYYKIYKFNTRSREI